MNTRRLIYTGAALLLGAGGLAGCDVQTFDDAAASFNNNAPSPPPPPTPPPPPPPPTGFNPVWSEIQANVFDLDCTSGCHSGANPSGGLSLEANDSYAQLVNVASNGSALDRVEPGQPDNSYLIHKLEGTNGVAIMPPGGALDADTITTIRQWITAGAEDDTAQPPAAPIAVQSLNPAHQSVLDTPPTQIVAGFTRELNQSTVTTTTFELIGAGPDNVFGSADDVAVMTSGLNVNATSATFGLNGVTLNDGFYRVHLRGDGLDVIQDLDGNALDGEFSGGYPSGDGMAGGDFVAQFQISTPVVIQPTLTDIQANIFTPSCATATCHSGGMPDGMLDLSAGNSFGNLVSIAAVNPNANGLNRVEPNDPDNSYLIRKLENTGNVGVMPPQGMLPQADINVIRTWIANGAQNN